MNQLLRIKKFINNILKKYNQNINEKKLSKISKLKEELSHTTKEKQKLEKKLEELLIIDYLLIDTNIWMDKSYEDLFSIILDKLSSNKHIIEMPNIQFDEIINLKNLPYTHPKSRFARCALGRIEKFQKEKLLKIIPLQLDSKKGAYADPEIIRILLKTKEKVENLTFISNDKELRIRVRQFLDDQQGKNNVIGGEEIVDLQSAFKQLESKCKELEMNLKNISVRK